MSQSSELSPHLPLLRRFARLLLGSQRAGDVLVLSTLQALSANKRELQSNSDIRLSLYRTLMRVWRSVESYNLPTLDRNPSEASGEGMPQLRELSRAVFLLRQLEEFRRDQVMALLDIDDATYDAAAALADEEVSYLLATDVMIIEDELLIAAELENILHKLGHSVSSIVRTAKQAVKAAHRHPPKLILSDIQLADGSSGIDAVRDILQTTPAATVFVTAYPERLLTGRRSEPTYMITKPFRAEQIKAVVSQVLFFDTRLRWNVSRQQLSEVLAREWAQA